MTAQIRGVMHKHGTMWATCVAFAATIATQEPLRVLEPEEVAPIATRLEIAHEAEELELAWSRKKWKAVAALAEGMITARKTDHRGYALEYLALLEIKGDRQAASQAAVKATKALGDSPLQLVRFIDRALYSNPGANEFQIALMALVPVVAAGRKVAQIRIAHLRALDGCNSIKEAAAANATIIEDLGDDTLGLYDLAGAICDLKDGKMLGQIALKAIERVFKEHSVSHGMLLLKYRILHDLVEDRGAARKLGSKIIGTIGRDSLNNWLWNLMTMRSTAGKYRTLALQSAEVMEESRMLTVYEYDTIALAFYRNGQIDKAIKYQKKSLEGPESSSDAEYRERLKMYLAAKKRSGDAKKPQE